MAYIVLNMSASATARGPSARHAVRDEALRRIDSHCEYSVRGPSWRNISCLSRNILKTITDEEVRFLDIRFTDTKGKEQHVTVPTHVVDEDFFEDGKMFDGSSIAGWKGINESDMVLMPDLDTAVMDPFYEERTLTIRCDVVEPTTGEGYERCPRSAAKRAEAYLKSSGVGDEAFFGPEPEFFVFDDVRWGVEMKGSFYNIDSDESSWNSEKVFEDGNIGHRPGVKGGYFPVPPVDSLQDVRSTMCLIMEEMGLETEVPSPRSCHGRSV